MDYFMRRNNTHDVRLGFHPQVQSGLEHALQTSPVTLQLAGQHNELRHGKNSR